MSDQATTQRQGVITWDNAHGHVCSCSRTENFTPIGAPTYPTYEQTVDVVPDSPPGPEGLWKYRCRVCGSACWSAR